MTQQQAHRPHRWHPRQQRYGGRLTVLHVAQPVEGGVARVVTDLVRAQTRAGLRVVLACPPGGTLSRTARGAGAEVLRWDAVRDPGGTLPRETAALARLVRRTAPDLIHAHSAKAGLALRLAVRGRTPTVFQPHAWSFEAVSGGRARLALRWERYAARWAQRILCVSEDERRRGAEAGIRGRWAVVPNGVDTEAFPPAGPGDARRARAALPVLRGLPAGAPLVVCVGRLCPQKGQDVLLRAWPRVAEQVPGARLALVGDGPAGAALRRRGPRGVLFAGATPDIAAWYAAADLVVQPSRWEGMALAPLEAMACGRPVLLSEVAGARESLPGRTGPGAAAGSGGGRGAGPGAAEVCLVPPEDPAALAEALIRLLADRTLREDLGRRGRGHVRAERDVRRTTAAVGRLYGELLGLLGAPPPEPPRPGPPQPGRPHRDREDLIAR